MITSLFDWVTYCKVAERLAEKNNWLITSEDSLSEASFRAAISKAYYGAFNKAKRYLSKILKIEIPRGEVHRFVINQFLDLATNRNDNESLILEDIGLNLRNLRDMRNMADYDDILLCADIKAEEAIVISQLIIESIDDLLA